MTTETTLIQTLGELKGSLDGLHKAVDQLRDDVRRRHYDQDNRLDNHSVRISKLERWQAYVTGLAAAAGAGAGTALGKVFGWIA